MRGQPRSDGVYGQLKWTKTGKEAVDGGDYRFFSSEYEPSDCVQLDGKRVRPLRLDGLTLTNKPSNKGGKPITSRSQEFRPAPAEPADVTKTKKNSMKKIASRLALSDEASEEAILAEVSKHLSRADITPDALKALQTENATLKKTNEELSAVQVEQDLEKYSSRIKPESKEKWKNRLLKDRTGTIELLEDMAELGEVEAVVVEKPAGRVLSRAEAAQPAPAKNGKTGGANEEARAAKIKSRAQELKGAAPARPFDDCWRQASGEIK